MPNGSYSDGITTTPARCTRSRRRSSDRKPGMSIEVGDALEVDLRLQLGEVAAAPADDALDPGHARAQQPHRRRQDLEALLVLHPPPREHERRSAAGDLARRPPRRVDAVRDQVRALRRQLEAVDDLADHEARVGEHGRRRVGEPRLDGVDRARRARRHPPAVLARARSRGTWRRASRRAASPACRRPRPPASRGRGRRRAATARGATTAARGGGWPRPPGRRARRRGATAGRCAPGARGPRRRCRRPATPGGST